MFKTTEPDGFSPPWRCDASMRASRYLANLPSRRSPRAIPSSSPEQRHPACNSSKEPLARIHLRRSPSALPWPGPDHLLSRARGSTCTTTTPLLRRQAARLISSGVGVHGAARIPSWVNQSAGAPQEWPSIGPIDIAERRRLGNLVFRILETSPGVGIRPRSTTRIPYDWAR